MSEKLLKSVIGNMSDLICIKCKKERKMRMSAYCKACKIMYEKNFIALHRRRKDEVEKKAQCTPGHEWECQPSTSSDCKCDCDGKNHGSKK